ncbi:hypothetical protein [Haladaptatus sp. DYF46]|uniref:hypothetical protein n=1 Tax=Haladaptatus sp. DYF46 TaxID=2886041 RepID=UPI001E3C30DB|nr:hypothetical protein [Haladaptatus sp. DYF46]
MAALPHNPTVGGIVAMMVSLFKQVLTIGVNSMAWMDGSFTVETLGIISGLIHHGGIMGYKDSTVVATAVLNSGLIG